MAEQSGAGSTQSRIDVIDALRGLALLGILLANVLVLSGWQFLPEHGRVALAGETAAAWQHRFHYFFVDGKFYTIFSLLFGAGFALQLDRLTRRGADGMRIYRRRALILLAIGLIHSWLVWDGDILTLYALMGLLLPFFYRLGDRVLLIASALLIFVVPFVGKEIVAAAGWPADGGLLALSDRVALSLGAINPADGVTWLRRSDFDGWFSFVMSGPFYAWGLKIASWRIAKVLGIMILGIWIGRRLAAGTLLTDRRLLWRVLLTGLAVGIPMNLIYAGRHGEWQTHWSSIIGTVPMGLAYAAAFALAWPRARRWIGLFAPAGRMALTNYLTQTIVCIAVFYGIGLGQIGRWPPTAIYAFALTLYSLQLVFSWWWLTHHPQGPMEKLWRRWTYGGKAQLASVPAAL